MLENTTKKTAEGISNGILLRVATLQNWRKSKNDDDTENKENMKKTTEGKEKDTKHAYFTMFMAELIGTGMLMFLGCMGCISVDDPVAPHHLSSMAFGLVVLLVIQTLGHVSGAHLNPSVTITGVVFKVLTPTMGIVYIIAQFLGAILGFALLKVLIPEKYLPSGFCMTLPVEEMTSLQALALEALITMILVMVVCAVWDKRNEGNPDSVPIRFGFIIVAIAMVAGPFTGASMNTARTFAPALLGGNWEKQWIYWIGPNVGAIIGCGVYKVLFSLKSEKITNVEETYHLDDVAQEKV